MNPHPYKNNKILAKDFKSTSSEHWKFTKGTEQTEKHRLQLKLMKAVGTPDSVKFCLEASVIIPPSQAQRCGSHESLH